MNASDHRLGGLVGIHAAGVLVLAVGGAATVPRGSYPWWAELYVGVLFGVVFGQIGLAAMWAGLGKRAWFLRLPIAFAAVVVLGTLLGIGIHEPCVEAYFVTSVAGLVMGMVCFTLRILRLQLLRFANAAVPLREGLQFTVRHLFLLTFVVACLVAIGKAVAPSLAGLNQMPVLALYGVVFAAVGLISLWAMLGRGATAVRTVLGVLIAIGLGFVSAFTNNGSADFWIWPFMTVCEAACLLATLAALRGCGYRLVRGVTAGAQPLG
jgi:hypothetical protein